MVCLGNICRSPMAEGVLRHKARELGIRVNTDSAGTIDHHAGEPPDRRAQATMVAHGIDISDLRARQFRVSDFREFDLILAMDASNHADLMAMAPDQEAKRKVRAIMELVPEHPERSVPDPYFGGDAGFEHVFHMLDRACDRLIDELR